MIPALAFMIGAYIIAKMIHQILPTQTIDIKWTYCVNAVISVIVIIIVVVLLVSITESAKSAAAP